MHHSQVVDAAGLSDRSDIGLYQRSLVLGALGGIGRPRAHRSETYMSAGTVAWKPRAAIVGAGGMGALFGSILQSGGLGGGFSARVENIAAAFSAAGPETHGSRDIIHDIWKKLVGNIAMSAVSGAANSTSAECLAVPELKATSLRALDKALAVAVSHGILLERDEAAAGAETISKTGGTGDNKSSLCTDLLNERPAEVDSIYGSVIS